jgi:hypothetical protein
VVGVGVMVTMSNQITAGVAVGRGVEVAVISGCGGGVDVPVRITKAVALARS